MYIYICIYICIYIIHMYIYLILEQIYSQCYNLPSLPKPWDRLRCKESNEICLLSMENIYWLLYFTTLNFIATNYFNKFFPLENCFWTVFKYVFEIVVDLQYVLVLMDNF